MSYWQERMASAQKNLFFKSRAEIDKQMRKYYQRLGKQVINDFESTYNKLIGDMIDGKQPTPADLYKLDKYWEMNSQLQKRLVAFGEKQVSLMSKALQVVYQGTYNSLQIKGLTAFTTIDDNIMQQVINQVWCADGKSWSKRIWDDLNLLKETLNDGLIECVVTGKKPSKLKEILQERFNVSYSRADALVRTEIAHIQTQAAQQRYKDYGLTEMEVWVDEDERTCPICAKHEGERVKVGDKMPVPFHPRCRCCMIPVIPPLNKNKE